VNHPISDSLPTVFPHGSGSNRPRQVTVYAFSALRGEVGAKIKTVKLGDGCDGAVPSRPRDSGAQETFLVGPKK
jgi:hypothetical protein